MVHCSWFIVHCPSFGLKGYVLRVASYGFRVSIFNPKSAIRNQKYRRGVLIMIERHVTFNGIPGKEKDFETLFKQEYSVAMSKQPGFVSVTLLKEHEKEAVYQMVIRFQSLETAAAWRDSADHKALSPKIKALYKETTVQVYEVIAQR